MSIGTGLRSFGRGVQGYLDADRREEQRMRNMMNQDLMLKLMMAKEGIDVSGMEGMRDYGLGDKFNNIIQEVVSQREHAKGTRELEKETGKFNLQTAKNTAKYEEGKQEYEKKGRLTDIT